MIPTNPCSGLSDEEVKIRQSAKRRHINASCKTKRYYEIIFQNTFTLFNLINIVLGIMVISVRSYRNALFLVVMFSNLAIGIIQEIRAKRAIDKLSVICEPTAQVIRNGKITEIPDKELVADDIMLLRSGMQICADGIIIEGECEVNESLLTGESDTIAKSVNSEVLSGSFVLSGFAKAQITRVGENSFSARITGSRHHKKPTSDMMQAINKIIKIVSYIIVPFGAIMFAKEVIFLKQPLDVCVTSTTAALIGMIPEGLVLLTSIALAVSTIRLSKKDALCQDLYCPEHLAGIDILCIDKTGTLTEGTLEVSEIFELDADFDVNNALAVFSSAFSDSNLTLDAIKKYFGNQENIIAKKTIQFSSERKFSAAEIDGYGTLVLGACEFLELKNLQQTKEQCTKLSQKGYRTVVFAQSEMPITGKEQPSNLYAKAIIGIKDTIRHNAEKTLEYFCSQNVDVKIISGDGLETVVNTAVQVNLKNARSAIDMTKITNEQIPEICEKYTVFCRATPEQKQTIIKSLKAAGHKVAMTGDGINDVLALRECDCSVAMCSGSDAAKAVSNIVLTNSDFASLPFVVAEGRRCINNIQRSASLFLTKTVFSVLLSSLYLFLPLNYPFAPIQLTLISALAIGIPSFLLALEPNFSQVKGIFLKSVMSKALPAGVSGAVGVAILNVLDYFFDFTGENISTMAVIIAATAMFGSLWNACRPFNFRRSLLVAVMIIFFILTAIIFHDLFCLNALTCRNSIICSVIALGILLVQSLLRKIMISDRNKP